MAYPTTATSWMVHPLWGMALETVKPFNLNTIMSIQIAIVLILILSRQMLELKADIVTNILMSQCDVMLTTILQNIFTMFLANPPKISKFT